MKNFVLLGVAMAALTFAGGKAVASSPAFPTLTMSGTVETVKTNILTKNGTVQTTQTKSFNNATIYLMISNAVAQGYVTGVPPTNLPAKGFIVFDYRGSDGNVDGIFFVTNKGTSFSYPLSGVDTNGYYYSYMEFDSDSDNSGVLGFDLGLSNASDDFNTVAAYNATSSETTTSTATFYVHDNPYAYDAADFWAWFDGFNGPYIAGISSPNPTENNYQFSMEMQGILTIASSNTSGSGSFTGSGNALIGGNQGVITSAKVTVK